MTSETRMPLPSPGQRFDKTLADMLAVTFAIVIVLYAASGPISDGVRWFIETTTEGFSELSRRDQRVLLREHWLGASYRSFEQSFLLPTGLIIGLPIVFSFVISLMTLHAEARYRWLNWTLAALSLACFASWIAVIFASDAGLLPSARPLDYVVFPLATAITLYLT